MTANAYLKFEDPAIAGGSADPGHSGEIEVMTWGQSFNQPTEVSRGRNAGQATHSDLVFTKYIDSASDVLMRFCWNGQQIGKAVLSCYRTGLEAPVLYFQVKLENVRISNFSVALGVGDLPEETVSLAYDKITYCMMEKQEGGDSVGERSVSHDLIKQVVS
ncbi:MAG TPA: type VI secretion system tube protein Hcp [Allosphingosinicella sp.]|nr:type VI secretion system tube protein Hcp [Allosphingosinicella sp.]